MNRLPKLVSLVLASMSGVANAAPTPEEVAVAQRHFTEAREHQAHRDWVGCENSVKQALLISETPGLRFHLAFCKEQQHRWVEALVDYRRAGELVASGIKADDVAELLPAATKNLEEQTPQLTLSLEEVPEGTRLYVDGKAISTGLLGVTFPVDPGTRRVKVTAPGHAPFLQEINLVPQDRRTVRVLLVETQEPEPAGIAPSGPARRNEPAAFGAMGLTLATEAVVALAGLGVGVGYTMRASSLKSTVAEHERAIGDLSVCDRPFEAGSRCAGRQDALNEARQANNYATAGYITAGAATAAFLVTWLVWPLEDESQVRVAPSKEGRGAFVSWQGRF